MTIGELWKSGLIDPNQKVIISLYDGTDEIIIYNGYAYNMNKYAGHYVIENCGIGTVTRYPNKLYLMVEEQNYND